MPSGRAHDAVTYILAVPTALGFFFLTRNAGLAALGTGAMLFGGLMFGPDLDTKSRQYTRWGVFRWLWWPYKRVMGHRSRLSHGILYSTFVRILYFLTVVTLLSAVALYAHNVWLLGLPADGGQALKVLQESIHRMARMLHWLDRRLLIVAFVGLWWGATTHTLTDFLVTTYKNASRSL